MDLSVIVERYGERLGFVAGLIAVVVAICRVVVYIYRLRVRLKAHGQAAKARLEEECMRLQVAGNTASARSDLGVYVNLELAKFQSEIASLRFNALFAFFLVFLTVGVGFHAQWTDRNWSSYIFFTLSWVIGGMACIFFSMRKKKSKDLQITAIAYLKFGKCLLKKDSNRKVPSGFLFG